MTIEFTDTEYRFNSGHAPRGRGYWGFRFEGHEFWATGTLTEAKKKCRAEVRRLAPKGYANLVIDTIMP